MPRVASAEVATTVAGVAGAITTARGWSAADSRVVSQADSARTCSAYSAQLSWPVSAASATACGRAAACSMMVS